MEEESRLQSVTQHANLFVAANQRVRYQISGRIYDLSPAPAAERKEEEEGGEEKAEDEEDRLSWGSCALLRWE